MLKNLKIGQSLITAVANGGKRKMQFMGNTEKEAQKNLKILQKENPKLKLTLVALSGHYYLRVEKV